jgi:L-iditol 2-dehydrogenase
MRAVLLRGIEDVTVTDVADPTLDGPGILVRIETCAVCGTDVKMYRHGYAAAKMPLVPGHELAGTIVGIQGSFDGLREGMRVAVAPNIPCGACHYCQRGEQTACDALETIGVHRDGGFAEYLALPARAATEGCVFPIPEGVANEEAALIDPASCVVNACELSRVRPGDTVVVLGAGPAGCLSIEVSRAFGARRTILVQRSRRRLAQASFAAASVAVDSSAEDAVAKVRAETDGRGAEVVIVACGSPEAQEQAVQMVAKRGSINLFGGLPRGSPSPRLDVNLIHYKEASVVGTHGGSNRHCSIALQMIADGRIRARQYVSRSFSLNDFPAALQMAEEKTGLKVFVSPRPRGS